MPRRLLPLVLIVALAILPCGCGDGGNRYAVSGRVTLDGEPLETGSIRFDPIEGTSSPNAGATIEHGRYAVAAKDGLMAGKFRVEIRAPRPSGKRIAAGSPAPPGTMIDEIIEALPERYNVKSTLIVDVRGNAVANFELTSK